MRTAAKRLKEIVSNKDIVPLLMHYIYRDGMLYASNGIMTAGAPCTDFDSAGVPRFAVLASEFQQFLDRSDGELGITVVDGTVCVKAGRMRAQFRSLVFEDGFDSKPDMDGETISIPEGFIERLSAIRPFVSDNATKPFATCILFREDDLFATSNVVLAHSKSNVEVEKDFLLPYPVADFIIKYSDGLQTMIIHENRSVHFLWENGSWLSAQGLSVDYPNVGPVIAAIPVPDWEVSPDWKSAMREATRLGNEKVHIYVDKIMTKTDNGTVYEIDSDTDFPDELDALQAEPKYVGPIFDVATHIKFVINGKKVHINFKNHLLTGVGLSAKL